MPAPMLGRTALERYARLEAVGEWVERPAAEPQEVVVSFGASTLVLTDMEERPLGHWALAGVQPIAVEDGATVYAMSPEGYERLRIRDAEMTAAISAVTRADGEPRPAVSGRAVRWVLAVLLIGVLAGLAAFAPPRITRYAASIVPPEAAEQFGAEILARVTAARGPICAEQSGQRPLERVVARVAPAEQPHVRILDLGDGDIALVPGANVLIDRDVLTTATEPEELAGWIALALARRSLEPPVNTLMEVAGPVTSLRYILTGRLAPRALDAYAARALAPEPSPSIGPAELALAIERLQLAGVSGAPLAAGLMRRGYEGASAAGTALAAEAPPLGHDPLLSDRDWVALQGLCG